ncbi:hypothetical protein AB0G64_09345 [Streptomyces longwoodensis]|uniref:hypothetical protein n=1 Tax=Streptomyces longwoodensis TaxID=68231 RepID=UPI00340054E0
MSNRVPVTVLLLIGEQAEITTPQRDHTDPERVSADRITQDTGIPREELPGAEVVAVLDDEGDLVRFERA